MANMVRRTLDRSLLERGSGVASVARQPIFDTSGRIWAYELLFRDPTRQAGLTDKNPHVATTSVMMDGLDLMLPTLREEQRFFINFTAELLENEVAAILSPDICAIEILEYVQPTPGVIQGIKNLKAAGFLFALDDYEGQEYLEPFFPLVDIVKVDVLRYPRDQWESLAEKLKPSGVKLLAEKVEDHATADLCQSLGFSLFQGFYFSKAELVQGKKLSPSQITKARLLAFSSNTPEDIRVIADAIGADVYLTYKLLRYVNSVYFGLTVPVRNVQHAMMLMGRRKVMQWLYVTALSEMDSAPMSREVVYLSALRAKFLELIGRRCFPALVQGKDIPSDLFLLGLFSLLEVLLHVPIKTISVTVPMDEGIVEALAGRAGAYATWLTLLDAYERADWETVRTEAGKHNLSFFDLAEAYAEAGQWSTALFGSL